MRPDALSGAYVRKQGAGIPTEVLCIRPAADGDGVRRCGGLRLCHGLSKHGGIG